MLAIYILIIVGSTNDEQLFRDSSIAVPFLSNISLRASYFYKLVPWIFVFFHFALLFHFNLLADKLHDFNHKLKSLSVPIQEDLRLSLSSFPFTHWLAGERNDHSMQFVTGLLVWITLFFMPLLTLVFLQVVFLPYHSDWTTLSHRLALLSDIIVLGFFWPRLVGAGPASQLFWWLECLKALPTAVKVTLWWSFVACFAWESWDWFFDSSFLTKYSFNEYANITYIHILLFALILATQIYRYQFYLKLKIIFWFGLVFCLLIVGINFSEYFDAVFINCFLLTPTALVLLYRADFWLPLKFIFGFGLISCLFIEVVNFPEVLLQRLIAFNFELFIIVVGLAINCLPKNGVLESVEKEIKQYFKDVWLFIQEALQRFCYQLLQYYEKVVTPFHLYPDFDLSIQSKSESDKLIQFIVQQADKWIQSQDKSQKENEQFSRNPQIFFRRQSKLTSSVSSETSTRQIDFSMLSLIVAFLFSYFSVLIVALPGNDPQKGHPMSIWLFEGIQLIHRSLQLQEMQLLNNNPVLTSTDLAHLEILDPSKLDPNDEIAKKMNIVVSLDLRGRDLRYAHLENTRLYGVDLRQTKLQGAFFLNSHLLGAKWKKNSMQGVKIPGAPMKGSDFTESQFQDASLPKAELQGADLSYSQLEGVDLSGAQLQGANLSYAHLHISNLSKAQLQGANLTKAILYGADLSGAQLQGADLSGAMLQGANLSNAQLKGANFKTANLSSVLLENAQFGLNDLRKVNLISNPFLYEYKTIMKGIPLMLKMRDERSKAMLERLKQGISGRYNLYNPPCIVDPPDINSYKYKIEEKINQFYHAIFLECMDKSDKSDYMYQIPIQQIRYFDALSIFISQLACGGGDVQIKNLDRSYIARSIAERINSRADEWWDLDLDGGKNSLKKLIYDLLDDKCIGSTGISIENKEKLKSMFEKL